MFFYSVVKPETHCEKRYTQKNNRKSFPVFTQNETAAQSTLGHVSLKKIILILKTTSKGADIRYGLFEMPAVTYIETLAWLLCTNIVCFCAPLCWTPCKRFHSWLALLEHKGKRGILPSSVMPNPATKELHLGGFRPCQLECWLLQPVICSHADTGVLFLASDVSVSTQTEPCFSQAWNNCVYWDI